MDLTYHDLETRVKALRSTHGARVREIACVNAPRTLLCVEWGDAAADTIALSAGVHGYGDRDGYEDPGAEHNQRNSHRPVKLPATSRSVGRLASRCGYFLKSRTSAAAGVRLLRKWKESGCPEIVFT